MAKTLIEIRAETSQYQQAMRQAAAEMKNLTAQHSLAAAQAKLSGSAQDALRARVTELTSKIDVQKGIVQQNGQQYDNLKQKLELQKTAHDQLKTKVEAAKKAYEDAIIAADKLGDDTEKAKAILKAQQTFADAIVKYYNAAAPLQLTVNKVTLKQSVTIGGETKESNVSKTVKEWLSDADNKDVYLAALIVYFGNDATNLSDTPKQLNSIASK